MCKSHLMIAIYSEWRPLLFTCLLWARPFIFEKSGRRGGGGGGVSFNRKNKSCTRKGGEQVRTQGSMGKHRKTLCKSHLFLVFV